MLAMSLTDLALPSTYRPPHASMGLKPMAMACALMALSGCAALRGAGAGTQQASAPIANAAVNGSAPSAPAFEVVIKGADKQEGVDRAGND